MAITPEALDALILDAETSIDAVAGALDPLPAAERGALTRTLGKKAQLRLWDLAEGRRPGFEDLVPEERGLLREVIHLGKNSLPLFSIFEKRFFRPPDRDDLLYGYNEGSTRRLVGPGFFVVAADTEHGAFVDYYRTPEPDTALPEGWPAIHPNERGLSRFVYARMRDYLRKVSEGVLIGRATKKDKVTSNMFLLARQDGD